MMAIDFDRLSIDANKQRKIRFSYIIDAQAINYDVVVFQHYMKHKAHVLNNSKDFYDDSYDEWCSHCGFMFDNQEPFNFCPKCGFELIH